jgi:serine phosphatase RsbU (regulator of sigma subunit)
VNRLNEDLCARLSAGRFVSLWLGIVDGAGSVTFVDAGHGHALVRTEDGTRGLPDPGDIPVGIDPDHRFRAATVPLGRRETVVVYSDGVTEQRGEGGEEFGGESLRSAMRGAGHEPEAIVRAIAGALERHSPGVRDDDATIAAIGMC